MRNDRWFARLGMIAAAVILLTVRAAIAEGFADFEQIAAADAQQPVPGCAGIPESLICADAKTPDLNQPCSAYSTRCKVDSAYVPCQCVEYIDSEGNEQKCCKSGQGAGGVCQCTQMSCTVRDASGKNPSLSCGWYGPLETCEARPDSKCNSGGVTKDCNCVVIDRGDGAQKRRCCIPKGANSCFCEDVKR